MLSAGPPGIRGVFGWDGHFINETGDQLLDGSLGGVVIRVAGNGDHQVDGTNERRQSLAGLAGETVSAERLGNFVTDMPRAQPHMFGIPHAEIDVADIQITRNQDAKVVIGYKATRGIAGKDPDKTQPHLTGRKVVRREREGFIHASLTDVEIGWRCRAPRIHAAILLIRVGASAEKSQPRMVLKPGAKQSGSPANLPVRQMTDESSFQLCRLAFGQDLF